MTAKASSPRRVLVTGANRGLGLELVRAFVAAGDHVWGSAREERPRALLDLDPAGTVRLDLGDEASIQEAVDALRDDVDGLDLLLNVAAVDSRAFGTGRGPLDVTANAFSAVMEINVTGPLMATRACLPLLQAGSGPMVVNVSSQLGSMQLAASMGSDTAYCVSKAALNMLSVKLSGALRADGIGVVMIHPGWVSTDMGGDAATLSPRESAEALTETISQLTLEDSGRFLRWDGADHPW